MPELPEVEITARTLRPDLAGRTIVGVRGIDYLPLVEPLTAEAFAARVTGRRITAVGRRAKFVLLYLENGDILSVHLRMTGRLSIRPGGESLTAHTRVALDLEDGRALHFSDARKFGRMRLLTAEEFAALEARLGPEPMADAFSVAELAARLRRRQRARLKAVLLDQRFLAGVGNIYADEALFRAGLHPLRPAGSLTPGEVARLHCALREVLGEAIAAEGTTLGDGTFLFGEGRAGTFAERLRVYGRTGEPCPACGNAIVRQVIAGRSTHFCPHCQK